MYAVASDDSKGLWWILMNVVGKSNALCAIVFIVFYAYSKRTGCEESICFVYELI
ncbi:hypothetical protein PMI32_02379 [Pseudomonas sp. GM60]|nr:hypothetical protein PMI32_02379 [Pseudomonas sp. GM60]